MKKLLALLLSAAMMLTLAVSCGDDAPSSSNSNTSGSSSEEETITPLTEITLPIVEDPITCTNWMVWSNDYRTIEEIDAYNKLAEVTNVYMDYTTVPGTAATEKFGLLLASGDYPYILDANMGSQYIAYPGGDDAGISDGIWRDLTDLIPIYCPNYMQYVNVTDDVRRQITTDEGRYAAMYMLRCRYDSIEDQTVVIEPEPAWMGLAIRQDWLDALNLEVPVTVDDLYNVLTAFKNAGYGTLGMAGNGIVGNTTPYLISAWGITNEFYVEEDGTTVGYGPVTDAYRDYCSTMNKWYEEGLIYQDFMSNTIVNDSTTLWANGTIGVYTAAWVSIHGNFYETGRTDNEDFWLTPMVNIVMNEGDTAKVTYQSDTAIAPMYITTTCPDEYVPYVLQWADYRYTWDGMLLGDLGVEGVSYEVDPSSEYYYVFTDAVMNHNEGGAIISPITARRLYNLDNFHGLYNWEIMWNMYRQAGQGHYLEGYETWAQETDDIMIPLRVSFTTDEGLEYNNLYVDCKSYVEENTVQFIAGTLDIDDDAVWENFISGLESMNYQRCLELKQTAYTRYMSK